MTTNEEKIIYLLGKTKAITDLVIDTKAIRQEHLMRMVTDLNSEIYNFIEGEK